MLRSAKQIVQPLCVRERYEVTRASGSEICDSTPTVPLLQRRWPRGWGSMGSHGTCANVYYVCAVGLHPYATAKNSPRMYAIFCAMYIFYP